MSESPRPARPRLPVIDMARGVAILAMVAYHLSWDLDALGLARFDLLGNPLWLAARTAILGSFLVLAGLSLVLATAGGLNVRRLLRRLGRLAAAAAAVSAASYVMFPDSPIFFGVLHHMAVAGVLGLAFLRLPWWLTAALGGAAWMLPSVAAAPLFDEPALRWLGLMTYEPDSNDYVPLFPWFGLVLAGIALGRLWGLRRDATRPGLGRLRNGRGGRALAWAGRHSLAIYLIHQPVMYGTLSLAVWLAGAGGPEARAFLDRCEASCSANGTTAASCATMCRCIADRARQDGLWSDLLGNRLTPDGRQRAAGIVRDCRIP